MAATRSFPLPRPPLHRLVALLAALLVGLLGWALLGALARATMAPARPVYTVAEIYDHLRHEPAAWVGQSVQVRGVFGACGAWAGSVSASPCLGGEPGLGEPGPDARAQYLPLTLGGPPPPLAFLRRLPLVGRLAPAPQAVVWGRPAVYRIQLSRAACSPLQVQVWCAGVLLDAAPAFR